MPMKFQTRKIHHVAAELKRTVRCEIRLHTDHSIHSVAFFRSERVYRLGHKTDVALQQAVSIALQALQALGAVPPGMQLPLGGVAGFFEGGQSSPELPEVY